jgi:succinylglutamate desuccinylase
VTAERVIDRLVGAAPGPTLVLVGGLHGNEPAGVEAAAALCDGLRQTGQDARLRGELVALRGNRRALALGQRAQVRDLNRMWTDETLAHARASADSPEALEQVELADALDAIQARARGPLYLLDLHTTSARGVPFLVVGTTAADRAFALALPLPGLVGLEVVLQGILSDWMSHRGWTSVTIEGGQSGSPDAVTNLRAALTLALDQTGVLPGVEGLEAARTHLDAARGGLPRQIVIALRHELRRGHRFKMEPGFMNIHATTQGTLLATDGDAQIRAPFDGFVLLPLYQADGRDGFFYGTGVR